MKHSCGAVMLLANADCIDLLPVTVWLAPAETDRLADDLAEHHRAMHAKLRDGDVAGAIRFASYAYYARALARLIDDQPRTGARRRASV